MRIAFQVFISFLLAYWPIFSMTSVMLFAAPGSTDNARLLLIAMAAMLYPALINGLLHAFKFKLWGMPSDWVFYASLLICLGGIWLFGYPRLYLNTVRGIANNGYSVVQALVYHDGRKIEADAATFQALPSRFLQYGKDHRRVYFDGKPMADVDPAAFRTLERNEPKPEGIPQDADATDGNSYFRFGRRLEPGGS